MFISLQILAGLVLLVAGGETLLRGGCRLASSLGMPPVLIALTVLAFGSSAPELFVCLDAAYHGTTTSGHAELALGNVVGSNLANLALVLGLAAMLRPLPVNRRLIRVEVPLLIALQLLLFPLLRDDSLSQGEALLLVGIGVLYVGMIVRSGWRGRDRNRRVEDLPEEVRDATGSSLAVASALTLIGLVLLPVGADLLVEGGTQMGEALGLSPRFIGLSGTAVGTSLPEVATTLVAIRRGNFAMAAGTVFGSNVFNLCFALGLSASLFPLSLPPHEHFHRLVDLLAALGITLGVSLLCLSKARISRMNGLVLLLCYSGVIGYALWSGIN